MKARHTLPLLLLAFTGPIAHADDAATQDARTQAMAVYAKKDAALKANDYAAFKTLADQCVVPSFTITSPDKKTLTLTHMLTRMKTGMAAGLPETADKTTLISMTVKGSHAVSVATNDAAGPFIDEHGKYGPKGKRHQFVSISHEQVKWVKQGDTWKVASVKIISEKDSVDGKPAH